MNGVKTQSAERRTQNDSLRLRQGEATVTRPSPFVALRRFSLREQELPRHFVTLPLAEGGKQAN